MTTTARTLVELYQQSYAANAERPAAGVRTEAGWRWLTYGEMGRQVDELRAGLSSLGLARGDRVGIISRNRVEWIIACYAVAGLGAVLVPMYEKQLPSEWQFILGDSGAKVAITSGKTIFDAVLAMRSELPTLEHVVGIDLPPEDPRSWAALVRLGAAGPVPVTAPSPEDVAQIVYTSGTTGKPKGVLLTHGNFVADVRATCEAFPIGPEERTVSFLPWAHVLGQIGELHNGTAVGASSAINSDLDRLLDDLREVQPTLLVAVPSIFNRIHMSVAKEVAHKSKLVQRIFRDGIAAAAHKSHGERVSAMQRLELALDDRLIFSKIRDKLGGRLKWVFCGGAALGREVAEFIDALGITVHEGYGLTETSCTATMQPKGGRKIGTAGRPLPGVSVDIDTSVTHDPKVGEIVIRGPIVMKGYHNRPQENAAAFTPDGGFRTGDLGYFDEDGYLVITGRIKEQYKLDNGKYVMPMALEEAIKLSPYVRNAMICGADRPYDVVLVVPEEQAIAEWAAREGRSLGELSSDPAVRRLLADEVAKRTQDFPRYQVPRALAVLAEDFTLENGLLTPTLKLKRQKAVARHASVIERLYREPPAAPPPAAEPAPATA
jgi:long-chain acyl-CoA synthetase